MKSAFFILTACVFFSGCASTQTHVADKDRHLRDTHRFFVERNLKDNHGVAESIVRALQGHGLEASAGPITMLPDSAQAVINYQDRWAWDFSEHMVWLKLGVRDPSAVFPYVTTTYNRQIALRTELDEVVNAVVSELLAAGKRQPAAGQARHQ